MGKRSDRRAARKLLDAAGMEIADDGDPGVARRLAEKALGKALDAGAEKIAGEAMEVLDDMATY